MWWKNYVFLGKKTHKLSQNGKKKYCQMTFSSYSYFITAIPSFISWRLNRQQYNPLLVSQVIWNSWDLEKTNILFSFTILFPSWIFSWCQLENTMLLFWQVNIIFEICTHIPRWYLFSQTYNYFSKNYFSKS